MNKMFPATAVVLACCLTGCYAVPAPVYAPPPTAYAAPAPAPAYYYPAPAYYYPAPAYVGVGGYWRR